MDPTEKKPEREIWDAESERRRSRNLKRKRMRNPKPKLMMDPTEKKPERETWDAETERRRSRKRMRKPNGETFVLAPDSDSNPDSMTYSEHEAEVRRRVFYYRYNNQARYSDGFDVDMYDIAVIGKIIPCDIDIYYNVAIKFAKFAVDDYNKKQPEGGIKLVFVKPLKCNIGHFCGVTYYITFEAKDVDALPDDQSRTYQTEVFDEFKKPTQVLIFRPKPTDKSEIITGPPEEDPEINQSNCVTDLRSYYQRETFVSEGYDISHCPPGMPDNMIKPMKLNAENTEFATKLGECALKSYYRQTKRKQRREKKEEKGPVLKLKFLQPLKMNKQKLMSGNFKYHLTFLAKVIGVPDDQSLITYQTKVAVYDRVVKVIQFRPKPTSYLYPSGFSRSAHQEGSS